MKTKTSKYVKGKSGSLFAAEHIRPKVVARNLLVGDELERRPPLGFKENFVVEPVRDRLLRYRRAAEEFAQLLRKRGLTAGDSDGPLKSSNVSFIHSRANYTSMLVNVKEDACLADHKGACTVAVMPLRKKKVVEKPAKPQKKGADGKTIAERLKEAMQDKGSEYRETDLRRDCNRIAGRSAEGPDFVTQQSLNRLLKGPDSTTKYDSIIAEALGVRAAWLQFGLLPKREDRALTSSIIQLVRSHSEGGQR